MLFGVMLSHSQGVDPTRIAAYVVSGVGFLGAGVIMRDGVNVRGVNTAATIWCSAAVGFWRAAATSPNPQSSHLGRHRAHGATTSGAQSRQNADDGRDRG
jgi:hypothetical protein